jgi:ring-1,2-phenylacetyl-CoA epoxidase subunit PaaD
MVTREQRAMMDAVAAAPLVSPIPLDTIWQALGEVPDPEVPAVSVVDLGIVRGIEWDAADAGRLIVRVTPTYSGCPATDLINTAIVEALTGLGVPRVRVDIVLSPAWTTDWIAPAAREKLRAFGIAPPECGAAVATPIDVAGISPLRRASVIVPCPRCASKRTELLSQFGSTACKAQYRCLDCREPFDYFKPH